LKTLKKAGGESGQNRPNFENSWVHPAGQKNCFWAISGYTVCQVYNPDKSLYRFRASKCDYSEPRVPSPPQAIAFYVTLSIPYVSICMFKFYFCTYET
jgi:hypothetical protein